VAMAEEEIISWFAQIVEELTGIPAHSVIPEADMADDLNISSLSMVEIITCVQDKYNVEIPDEALAELRTVRDVVSYIERVQPARIGLSGPGNSAPEAATM
jgi:acyl carrier protein